MTMTAGHEPWSRASAKPGWDRSLCLTGCMGERNSRANKEGTIRKVIENQRILKRRVRLKKGKAKKGSEERNL